MAAQKWGVLLMAYGGPNNLDEVEPYYTHILRGRKPSPEMLHDLIERYRAIGGKSPINEITFAQARLLQEKLSAQPDLPHPLPVYVGMKHWHPYIAETVEQMLQDGITDAVGIILAPHFSRRSVAEYIGYAKEALQRHNGKMRCRFVSSWAAHPLLIACFAQKVQEAKQLFPLEAQESVQVLFTAHSLPQRILEWNDPYPEELQRTASLVAQQLGLNQWHFAYQSASGTDWLGPDILEKLEELAQQGHQFVLVAPIGFLCDHLEVLYDIDIEAQQKAAELGITVKRIAMPNTDPLLIDALADIALKALRGRAEGFTFAEDSDQT